ncbi:MAG: ExbD/TolR family protein [Roseateles sp.]|uniref:ExbD/TolR family protein n=1 Tax=Roseateles sp. TaxID=1971397 RepID=UPI004036F2C9
MARGSEAHLFVTDDGQYLLQGKAIGLPELDDALQALKAAQPDVELHLVGSSKVTYEQVPPAMRLVQKHGLAKIGVFAGDPPDLDPVP